MSETFFITGATGNIGGRLVPELLKDTGAQLFLLITGKDQTHAQQKGQELLDFWDVNDPSSRQRVKIFWGDIKQNQLGLTSVFEELSGQVTQIIHCAANLKLNMSLPEARATILEGTKNTVVLAKRCQARGVFKRFHYISTLEISGKFTGTFKEEYLPDSGFGFLNTYEQVKAETEKYLQSEHLLGLALTIYRPSMVVGDSKTGRIKNFQSFYYLLRDMVFLPQAPILPISSNFRVEIAPVDFIAQIISAVAKLDISTNGKIYHLTIGGPQALTPLPKFIKSARQTILKLSGKQTPNAIFVSPAFIYGLMAFVRQLSFGKSRKFIENQLIFLQFFFLDVIFDNSQMRHLAEINDIKVPAISECLEPLCKFYLERSSVK